MPYTFNYSGAFAPGVGEALAQGAKQKTDFARIMQNNKIELQERELAQQQARIALEESRLDLQRSREARIGKMQERRMDLQEKQFGWKRKQTQKDRQLQRKEQKLQQKKFEREMSLQEQAEERRQQALEHEIEQSDVEDKEALRQEYNRVREMGGQIGGEKPGPDYYEQELSNGRTAWVPRTSPEEQREIDEEARVQRNSLRKGGAQKVPEKNAVPGDMAAYKDPKGQWWAVPPGQSSKIREDYRDNMESVLKNRISNQKSRRGEIVQARQNINEEIQSLNEEIRSKESEMANRNDKDSEEYKRAKTQKQNYEERKQELQQQLESLPTRKDMENRIQELQTKWERLITPGQETAEGEEGDGEGKTTDSDLTVSSDKFRDASPDQVIYQYLRRNPEWSHAQMRQYLIDQGILKQR